MTTLYLEEKRCAVCGAEHEYPGIASTNAFGSPDLDTRPPEMLRWTIVAWVQRCPKCGYCASNISKASDQAISVIRSKAYHEQLSDPSMPELANSFLCKSIIDETAGDYVSAAWSLIHAAWVCDDEAKPESAKKCRCRAANMILKARKAKQNIADQDGADVAILVDLLRRAGNFSEAMELIRRERSKIKEDVIMKILNYQEYLVDLGDTACHTIAEAIGEE